MSSCLHTHTLAAPCVLSQDPYGPICSAQIIAVASYLLKEKLRDLLNVPSRHGGEVGGGGLGGGWGWGAGDVVVGALGGDGGSLGGGGGGSRRW